MILVADRGRRSASASAAASRSSRRARRCSSARVAPLGLLRRRLRTGRASPSSSGSRLMIALIVGWLVQQVSGARPGARSTARAESEELRDELGRRADLLDAANRCARALGSSLELDEAFGAFIRELRSLVPFDRTAIILMEGGQVRVMATAGHMADEVLRPGEALPPGALIEEVLRTGETVYRRDMSDHLLPGGGDADRDRPPLAASPRRSCSAPGRSGCSRSSRSAAGGVRAGRDRAGRAARPPGRDRGAEHPLVRGRARDRRGAAAPLGAAGRLRLARLARAAQPDGGGDRRGADAPGPLARADARPADIVPGADRRRDEPAGDPDRRRPRHLADRGGHVLVHASRTSTSTSSSATRSRGVSLGQDEVSVVAERAGVAPARARRPRAAPPGADEPGRERGQVLAGRRGGGGAYARADNGPRAASRSRTAAPGSRATSRR